MKRASASSLRSGFLSARGGRARMQDACVLVPMRAVEPRLAARAAVKCIAARAWVPEQHCAPVRLPHSRIVRRLLQLQDFVVASHAARGTALAGRLPSPRMNCPSSLSR
jgi:hypothetical protein